MRHWFVEKISAYAEAPAIAFEKSIYSYKELLAEVDKTRAILQTKGIHAGEVIAILGDYSFRSVAAFLALMENRNIIVPITSKADKEIKDRLREGYVDRKISPEEDYSITTFHVPEKHSVIKELQRRNHAGLILFSSGSTGTPKAIVEDMEQIAELYRRGHGAFRTLVFLMFDHIGGINTLLHILTSGGFAIFSPIRDTEHVCHLLEKHRVEVLPTSPTFLNLILIAESHKRYDLNSLKLITYGTEPMPEPLLKRLKHAFPKVRLKQTFGTSETGILSTKSKADDSLFMKLGGRGFEYKIANAELYIRSKSSMLGYLNAENPFTKDGWFPTGDMVEVDEEGYIKIIGRVKEVINVGGEKVLPEEVESVLLEMPFIVDAMAYSEENSITGQSVTVDVVVKNGIDKKSVKKRIRAFCRNRLERYKIPTKVNLVEKIHVGDRFKKIRKHVPQ